MFYFAPMTRFELKPGRNFVGPTFGLGGNGLGESDFGLSSFVTSSCDLLHSLTLLCYPIVHIPIDAYICRLCIRILLPDVQSIVITSLCVGGAHMCVYLDFDIDCSAVCPS